MAKEHGSSCKGAIGMKRQTNLCSVVIIAIAALLITSCGDIGFIKSYASARRNGTAGYKVISVADGDTFRIRYGRKAVSVRLIGVDTPESCHAVDSRRNTAWGRKASRYTKKQLYGKTVYLSFDKVRYDKYGRLLAYVYLKNAHGKKVMYNRTLVGKGYARAACYEPNHKFRKVFEKLEKQAKKKKKGFWKDGFRAAFPAL